MRKIGSALATGLVLALAFVISAYGGDGDTPLPVPAPALKMHVIASYGGADFKGYVQEIYADGKQDTDGVAPTFPRGPESVTNYYTKGAVTDLKYVLKPAALLTPGGRIECRVEVFFAAKGEPKATWHISNVHDRVDGPSTKGVTCHARIVQGGMTQIGIG